MHLDTVLSFRAIYSLPLGAPIQFILPYKKEKARGYLFPFAYQSSTLAHHLSLLSSDHCLGCSVWLKPRAAVMLEPRIMVLGLWIMTLGRSARQVTWLIHLCWEKCGILPRKEVKRIKADALARLIVVNTVMNEGGKKRSSSLAQEMLVEKKLKTSSAARRGLPAAERPVIDMTSTNGKKNEATRSKPVAPAMLRMARAKFGSALERLSIMKSDKVDTAAKVALRPTPSAAETDSPARKEETAHVGSCEKSTKSASREAAEICALLKPNLFEDMDACAKFVDDVKGVVCPSSFVKHMIEYRKIAQLAMIQDLECAVSELCSATYAKDEELIAAYNQMIHSKKVIDRHEPQVLELQGALKINKSLKKEVDELQCVRVDFETFSISSKDLIAFTFETSNGEVVGDAGAEVGVARGEAPDGAAAENVLIVEGVATE
ncbi:copper-transporting ATPase HMA5 [Pyrus ussuriensis x Pyrus communis]|uniref:Copper-transporting ATPase HMA5 n=1 Tax=Pyrus ussuriensis x Pyrus communis TaxID=2448454 RepID=A0A5N5GQE3_9ROSA|nr:copper-transporting ATPase HMA5 [Pyrus ussuriensis x Pyrus communis]